MGREEATRRGFGPDTTKTVQIVLDGAKGLKEKLEPLFPNAIITLDVCHVVEKLWELGHRFHKEGSEELKAWVEELKELVYQGRAATLVKRLQTLLKQVPMHGPGTKGRRQALKKLIGYLKPAIEDDAISQMDIGGLGHCQWSSGRSGAARCWRTDGLRRHALDT